MKRATDYAKHIPDEPNRTMPEYTKILMRLMRADGVPHSLAQKDSNGKCLTCGMYWLCPGVHTFDEIQAANRLPVNARRYTLTGFKEAVSG